MYRTPEARHKRHNHNKCLYTQIIVNILRYIFIQLFKQTLYVTHFTRVSFGVLLNLYRKHFFDNILVSAKVKQITIM